MKQITRPLRFTAAISSLAALLVLLLFASACGSRTSPREAPTAQSTVPVTEHDSTGIVTELNRMRSDPVSYGRRLAETRLWYQERILRPPGKVLLETEEGVAALDEAVAVLLHTAPLPAVVSSEALANAARDHVRDIGPRGLITHEGTDGSSPSDRMARYAHDMSATAEVISFGPDNPTAVIGDLLIDDGVRDRGHRKILLDGRYRIAGAACGPHAKYRFVCVVDLADQLR